MLIGLAPDGVSALRYKAGLRPDIDGRWLVRTATSGAADATIEALSAILREAAGPADDIDIVLSNHFAHYAVLPGDPKIRSAAETMTLAAIVMEQQYGHASHDWDVRVGTSGRGKPRLASGVAKSFLAVLREKCDGKGRLRSVQPALMPVFNRVRRSIGSGDVAIAIIEVGRITLALCRNGDWAGVASRAANPDDPAALGKFLTEIAALNALSAGGTLWLCDLTGRAAPPPVAEWHVRRVALPHPESDGLVLAALGALGS